MKAYEILYFVDPITPETEIVGSLEKIQQTIKKTGGKIDSVDNWGKKKLAYEIDEMTDGDYTLVNFEANPEDIAELDRICRISDVIKRHMIVRRPETKQD